VQVPITGKENDPVIRTSSSSNQTDRNSVLRIQAEPLHAAHRRFEIPVMRETLLLLELEAQEFCVDLGAFSQRVLSDLGATLQVLRLAGREFGRNEECPTRIEDCVAAMGVQACIDAMSAQLIPLGGRSNSIAALWCHSREIARQSKNIAEQMAEIDAGQAYLVGLCHSIGSLPAVLGWSGSKNPKLDSISVGIALAREWSLPVCVVDYLSDLQNGGGRSPWPEMVRAAHRCGDEYSCACAFSENLAPQLLWAV
jgi:HD-like signal output (HDOD) protein